MRSVILPHNMASEGSKALSSILGFRRIRRENSAYRYNKGDVVINWGCPERPNHIPEDAIVINDFESVANASNKIRAFEIMNREDVSIPNFTTDEDEAYYWSSEGNKTIVARTVINGHGGNGIVICEPGDFIPDAKLYTMYVPKKSEYRVHVFDGRIIDVTRKVLREDYPDKPNVNWKVRNHANGFIFTRFKRGVEQNRFNEEKHVCPNWVKEEAIGACNALCLSFGAVDVIYNQKENRAYVLEVNTAPGIADIACDRYANSFRSFIENEDNF